MPNTQNCKIRARRVPYKYAGFWNAIHHDDEIRYLYIMKLLASCYPLTF